MKPWIPTTVLLATSMACAACGGDDAGASTTGGTGGGTDTTTNVGASGQGGDTSSGGAAAGGGAPGGGGQGGNGCVDTCPAPGGGITWGCEKRFMYGLNYAWRNFAGDFGGIPTWGQTGVSQAPNDYLADLTSMRQHGVGTVRWWVFPDFRGDGVQVDGNETPTGLSAGAVADVQKALELADQAGVELMLTIFSFDNFNPSKVVQSVPIPGIHAMIVDATKRTALLENVVRPLAQAVEASPHKRRMIAWDVINEPEWAMTGPSLYGGDEGFDPTAGLEPLDHAGMESFLADVIAVLRGESGSLVTVGSAAVKWAHAWTHLDLDFYQFHHYDWVDTYWPYTNGPATYGLDKPTMYGEFPLGPVNGASYQTVVDTWFGAGYAGAMAWMFDGASSQDLALVDPFAQTHPCETQYGQVAARLVAGSGRSRVAIESRRACRRGPAGKPICE